MHELFFLSVDFSVGLICFVMSKQVIQRFVQKTHKQKMVKKKKKVRRKCFI